MKINKEEIFNECLEILSKKGVTFALDIDDQNQTQLAQFVMVNDKGMLGGELYISKRSLSMYTIVHTNGGYLKFDKKSLKSSKQFKDWITKNEKLNKI